MKKELFTLVCIFIAKISLGQTVVFSDNFNTGNSATYTTIPGTLGGWTLSGTVDWGARKNSNRLELTNDASAAANTNGYVFVSQNTSAFASPYNTLLNANTAPVSWYLNIRQIRTDPGGVDFNNGYAAAFVLASNSTDPYFNLTADGYAISYGQSGATDPLKLFHFTNGMNNRTNIITATAPAADLGTEFLSVKITYIPCSNQWQLFVRNDGGSFSNPTVGTLTSVGTGTNSTYTSVPLNHMGCYWQGSTTAAQDAYFDNISVVVGGGVGTPGLWTGAQNTNWFDCRNWSDFTIPTSSTNVTFSTDNATSNNDIVLVAGTTAECNNLSIIGGSANDFSLKGENDSTKILRIHGDLTINGQDGLDFSDGANGTADGTIEIKGNWNNIIDEGEFKQGNSTVIFNGTGNQTISCVGPGEIFYNLLINKPIGNVVLNNNNIEVGGHVADLSDPQNGVLTLTQGNLITGTYYVLVSNTTMAGISGGNTTSFIDGSLRRMTAATGLYDFPTGEGTRYMRAGIRTSTASANTYEIDAQNTGYGIYSPLESTLFDISHLRWWNISRIAGSTSNHVNIRLYWLGTPASEGITNVNDLVVAHYSNRDHTNSVGTQQWWNRGRSAANSSGLVNDGYVESSEAQQNFSPHTLGTITNSNPLPVELISYHANCINGTIHFTWSTSSETNNDHFEIEGSVDGIEYNSVCSVPGAGNTNTVENYSYDYNNVNRYTYFRLVQYDYNGIVKHYTPLYISCENVNNILTAWINGNYLQLNLPGNFSTSFKYEIMDMNGRILKSSMNIGHGTIGLENLSSGIYLIIVTDLENGNVSSTKFFMN